MKKFLICLLAIFMLASLTACGNNSEGEKVSSARALTRKLASESDKKIAISEDIVLTEAIEIVGNKEIVGTGTIKVSADNLKESYVINVTDGAQLTIGGKTTIDLSSLAGGIYVKEGAAFTLQEEATVKGASNKTANTLVEGTFNMNGGTITEAYNNIVCAGKSTFVWNAGTVSISDGDAIVVGEDANIKITSADAKLETVAARGLYLRGEGLIENTTMTDSMDSMIKVGPNGKLTFKNGKISDAGLHGIDNAGELVVAGGTIFENYDSGICNTGSFEMIGGTLMNNKNKGVLNKNGTAKIVSPSVTLTGNRFAIGNEEGASFELAQAKILQSTTTNVYAYGGEMYIHDIVLATSGSNNMRVVAANVTMEDMEIKGINASGSRTMHGLLLEGGNVTAKNVIIGNTTGNAIRNKGGNLKGENITIKDVKNIGIDNQNQDVTGREGIIEITNLTVDNVKNNNVLVADGKVTLINATLERCVTNNIKTTGGKLILKNSVVNGNVAEAKNNNHAIYMTGGTIEASNVKVQNAAGAILRMNGEEALFNGKKVTFKNAGVAAINQTVGIVKIDGLKTNAIKENNIMMSKGTVELKNSTLCPVTNNNIRLKGEGKIVLTDVEIQGHVAGTKDDCHAIFPSNGTIIGTNLKIHDVAGVAVRVNGENAKVVLTGVDIDGAGYMAYRIGTGEVTITDTITKNVKVSNVVTESEKSKLSMTNATFCPTESNNVRINNGTTSFENVEIQGTVAGVKETIHGFFVSKGTTKAKNITISDAKVAAVRVNNDAKVTLDGVKVVNPGQLGIQVNAGTTVIRDLTTSGVPSNNIQMYGNADLTVKESTLGKNADNSVRVDGDVKLTLEDVTIEGHVKDAKGTNHGIYLKKGTVIAKDLSVKDVQYSAIRVSGGNFEAEEVSISNMGDCGINASAGITEITTFTTDDVKNNAVYISGSAKVNLTHAEMNLEKAGKYGIYSAGESSELTGKDITLANVTYGIGGTSGKVTLTDVDSTASYRNVEIKGLALQLIDADMYKTPNNNVVADGTGSELTLNDVRIWGNEGTNTGNHGLYIPNGKVIADKLYIEGTSGAAVRMNKGTGSLEAKDVTFNECGTYGLQVNGGTVDITGLTTTNMKERNVNQYGESTITLNNAILDETESEYLNDKDETVATGNIAISQGTLNLNNVEVKGTTKGYGIHQTGGNINVENKLSISNTKLQGVYLSGGKFDATADSVNMTVDTTVDKVDGILNYGAEFSAKNLTVKNTTGSGIQNQKGGTMNLTNVYVTGVKNWHSIKNTGAGSTLTINGATFDKSPSNNVVADKGTVNLNGVITINGTNGNHALQILNDAVVNLDGELKIDSAKNRGLSVAGTSKFNSEDDAKITISNSGEQNVYIEGTGKATLNHATFGKTKENNIRVISGEVVINNSTVEGNTGSNFVHGILVSEGKATLNNVMFKDTNASGIRTNQSTSDVIATNITVQDAGEYGISHGGGKLSVTNLTVTNATSHGICNVADLTLAGAINASVYNDAAKTVNASGAITANMTIDWAEGKIPENRVGIQFVNAEDMKASQSKITLGPIAGANNVSYFYGTQMLINDKQHMNYTVTNYSEFMAALEHVEANNLSSATITIAGEIVIPQTVTINEGREITIQDDGTARKILRGVPFTTTGNDRGVMFDVNANASLTFRSNGTDKAPKLTIDGNKANVSATTGNWAIVNAKENSKGVNVFAGVEFVNNSSYGAGSVIRMEANSGALTVDGGQFRDNTSNTNNGGVFNIANTVESSVKNAAFSGNIGNYGGVFTIANNAQLTIENCEFVGNTATGNGGAISTDNQLAGGTVIKNCTFKNNTANGEGGAVNASTGADLIFEDCTFTGNVSKKAPKESDGVTTNWGNDIRLGGATNTISVSGKMVVEIFNRNASKLTVKGVLEEGSDVMVEWCASQESRVPQDKVGVAFDNDEAMNANAEYITLGAMAHEFYSFKYADASAKLEIPYLVPRVYDDLQTAIAAIDSDDKVGVIRLTDHVNVSSEIAIPSGCDITIEDNGEEEPKKIAKTKATNMFVMKENSTLTFRSSGSLEQPKLIIDGGKISSTGYATVIFARSKIQTFNINILEGVKFMNNITGGNGSIVSVEKGESAQLYVDGAWFEGNKTIEGKAGGVFCLTSMKAEIHNSKFVENEAGYGGVIEAASDVTITNSTFSGNKATKNAQNYGGGAIYQWGKKLTLTDCTFKNNTSAYDGGVIYNNKGQLILTGTKANALFQENTASNWGGAVYTTGGTFKTDGYTFTGNKAKYGGAILLYTNNAEIDNVTFNMNEATSNEGGAIYIGSGTVTITDIRDSYFEGNIAKTAGGAISHCAGTLNLEATESAKVEAMFKSNTATSGNKGKFGGAIYYHTGTLNLTNYKFESNSPQDIWNNTQNAINNTGSSYTDQNGSN